MTQAAMRHVAVIDIGKTNAKVVLVALDGMAEIAVRRVPNQVRTDGPYPHHDVERLWQFILESLGALHREHGIDAISVTTHGATAALVSAEGTLALPVIDYEHDGPDRLKSDYSEVRPPFAETGSPKLAGGLNIGAQLFWQQRTYPADFGRTAAILMYPQYWVWRLTGVTANEITSLGCHTDLWNIAARDYSSLVDAMGWRALMPPLRAARERIGPVTAKVADATGLPPATPVHCGIHDSNASLLPHLVAERQPFSVVSTGTWVIAMAVGGAATLLDPARDTLINVSADGGAVPSARFMGGREYEIVTGGARAEWTEVDVDAVLAGGVFLLPSVQPGSGPFPMRASSWIGEPGGPSRRHVVLSFYLAMMTSICLELIGAAGETIVEGPFADNALFLAMLASATGRDVRAGARHGTGTSSGAALLAGGTAAPSSVSGEAVLGDDRLAAYARQWRKQVDRGGIVVD